MSFFDGLEAEAYDRTYSNRELIRRMVMYFRPQARRLSKAALAVLAISGAWAAGPILVARGVDWIAAQRSPQAVFVLIATLFLLGLFIWVGNWFRRRLTSRAVGDVMLTLRHDAFAATTEHDLSFHDEFSSGKIVSRITSDTQEFAAVVLLLADLVDQVLESLILLIVLLGIDLRLTLWLVSLLPLLFFVALGFRRLARAVTRTGFRAMANVNDRIKESVTGIAVAKNFRQESAIHAEFEQVNRQSYRMNVRRGFVLSIVFPVLNAMAGAGTALLVYLGGLSAAQGAITVGAWYLYITSLDRFWFPVLNLSSFWSQIQGGLTAAERVFALIDARPAVVQIRQEPSGRLRGEIEFRQLDFHYTPSEPVLRRFSLHIRPGENLALVGHTGAGKSSIGKLIARFYEFQDGGLLVDGQDIRALDLRDYRRQLGIVAQVPFLFSGTVAENIRYARPEVSEAEIEGIAQRIGEGEWLEGLPGGLHSQVGERGGRLSMGQRQLVSLMRVLVQHPSIFILDEATASIDPFTESQIQQALSLILAETTSILIAHRLSTVRAADRIIVLRQGEIIEEGSHSSLMAAGGHYGELYNAYFRHQSIEYVEQAREMALEGG